MYREQRKPPTRTKLQLETRTHTDEVAKCLESIYQQVRKCIELGDVPSPKKFATLNIHTCYVYVSFCLFINLKLSWQELKKQRVEHGNRVDSRSDGVDAAGERSSKGASSASFLDKMRGDQMENMGLEERMQRNRHYQQRGADVHNFMERR